mmetsp:Transcript_1448/g.2184  ORF Transcript_1448/g.2184 Transcript_1448/m.2184 type:complete len:777 (+) Transcript_1448:96-2426(+)
MVGFDQSRSMGEAAATTATSNFKNTIFNIKRLLGLEYNSPKAQEEIKRCPFTCVPYKHEKGLDTIGVKVSLNGEEKVLPIEAVAGMMVKHLGNIAGAKAAQESKVGDKKDVFPQDWVIAIPGYYNDAQRRAMLVGCEIVGINGILRLMHEHTAVALSYGIFKDLKKEFNKEQPTNVLFIDMGDSCYTASVVAFETGKLAVKSCFFDENLGGRDFDEVIAQWLAAKFEEKYKGKLSAKPMDKPKVRIKLLAAAEKAKKTLSPQGVREARISLECLMDDFDFSITLKADEYKELCQPLLARLEAPVQKALEEAQLSANDLASVEIVGGSTRIGSIKKTLISILGVDTLSTTMNADEAVSRGAALQSAILSPRFKVLPYEIQEAQPYPIKLSWDEGAAGEQADGEDDANTTNSVVMFDRGLNFPIVRRVTLKRAGEFNVKCSYDPTSANYGFQEGGDICDFIIASPKGDLKKIRVNVKQDIHGIINLSSGQMIEELDEAEENDGVEPKEGEEKKKKIKKTLLEFSTTRPIDWSRAEKERSNEEEVSMDNVDRIIRETSDMRNELESYLYSMRDKIISERGLAPYATEDEKATFATSLENTENWLYEEGFDAIKSVYAAKLGDLKKVGDPIEFRASENEARPAAFSSLQKKIEMYQKWLNEIQGKDEFAHITDDERQTCLTNCDETSSWMYDMMDKQGSVSVNVNPVVTVSEINTKNQELTKICSGIKHKPVPKPKKETKKEEKKEEPPTDPPAADGEAMETDKVDDDKAEDKGEPMETD